MPEQALNRISRANTLDLTFHSPRTCSKLQNFWETCCGLDWNDQKSIDVTS